MGRGDRIWAWLVVGFGAMALAMGVACGDEGGGEREIPPHVGQVVEGVHGYAAHSVRAGEEIALHVSSTRGYQLAVVRLGDDPEGRSADVEIFRAEGAASPAEIFPGSYVHLERCPPCVEGSFSASGWVRPFRVGGVRQGILTRDRDAGAGGWGLVLEGGKLVFRSERGRVRLEIDSGAVELKAREWAHIAVAVGERAAVLWIDGQEVGRGEFVEWEGAASGEGAETSPPLRIGAAGVGGRAGDFFDGDVAGFALFDGELDVLGVRAIYERGGLGLPDGASPEAYWDFSEEGGEVVGDRGDGGFDGTIVNHGTWMIGGPSFCAGEVGRFDAGYDPALDEGRGHGLRLSSDDLYDCRWPVAHRVAIPEGAPSGYYCGRFSYQDGAGQELEHHVTFVVRAAEGRAEVAPIVVLAAAKTWRAYNWFPFSRNLPPGRHPWGQGDAVRLNPGHEHPSYSLYGDHRAGQPTYQVGLKVPCPAADPYRTYRGHSLWGQWVANERLVPHWLDRHGYEYEVVSDFDLDADAGVLEGRRTLFIIGHSEYWSDAAYGAVDEFLKGGGQLVVMSANTMFWRVDTERPGVMGCRKYPRGMLGSAWTTPGEIYHGGDGGRGGLMRFSGRPAWRVVGLETAGWGRGMDFLPYTVSAPEHPFFHEPHEVGLGEGEEFGYFGDGIGMVGHEYDVRPSVLVAATREMPPGYEDVADPGGMVVLAACLSDRKIIDYHANENLAADNPAGVISEILYWERPEGGKVFNIGTVSGPWGLYYDRHIDLLVRNVLHHYGHGGR